MKYLAFTLPELEPLHNDVPLQGVVIHEGVNEPDEITGTLRRAVAYSKLRVEGADHSVPLIRRRGTLLVADDGNRQQGFIVEADDEETPTKDTLAITGVGYGWLLKDAPWLGKRFDGVDEDPLDIVRRIFDYVTSYPGTIDIQVDNTRSPVRIGDEEQTSDEFTRADGTVVDSFDYGPYRLNWWQTSDLYKNLEDLAAETPFEWAEETVMSRTGDTPPQFRIRLGWPRLEPIVRHDHHFEIGLNVTEPQQPEDEDFFTDILVLGNGDGSAKRRGRATRQPTGRHRTPKVITDQGLTSNKLCAQLAQEMADRADRESRFIETCRVMDHPAARVGTFGVGDVIFLQGETVWDPNHLQKCRIKQMDRRISDNSVALTLERWG